MDLLLPVVLQFKVSTCTLLLLVLLLVFLLSKIVLSSPHGSRVFAPSQGALRCFHVPTHIYADAWETW